MAKQSEQVQEIPISELFPFKDHPFRVLCITLCRQAGRDAFCPPKGDIFLLPRRGDASFAPARAHLFSECTGGATFAVTPQLSLRGHTFFCLARKKYAKKRRRTRNSAYARKDVSLHFTCCRFPVRSPNALRANLESGFRIARYALRVVRLVPVEYLTYEIRGVSDLA